MDPRSSRVVDVTRPLALEGIAGWRLNEAMGFAPVRGERCATRGEDQIKTS